MAYAAGTRVRITSGTHTGKLATVIGPDAGGRVVVHMDGFADSKGYRAYVPSSLELIALPVIPAGRYG